MMTPFYNPIPFSLKSLGEKGSFEGYASVFSLTDSQKERVNQGAFTQSLAEWRQKKQWPKMLWQHNMAQPIGRWTHMAEDNYGLFVKGQILMDLSKGREAYTLLKEGIIDSLSIGFIPVRSHYNPLIKCKILDQVDLQEVSLVTYGANPQARVIGVKTQRLSPWDRLASALYKLNF